MKSSRYQEVMNRKRAIIIVLDGVGIGSMPDASLYGDEGANTLGHVLGETGVCLPNLASLGLGNLGKFRGLPAVGKSRAYYGALHERSAGKDTVTGHWEMMGITVKEPFPVFPDGFPPDIMRAFETETGYGYLWNRPASGTEIIERLGSEHMMTGKLIVYTSADSVFQIAAHNDVLSEDGLYDVCRKVREIANSLRILRVIARPFSGQPGQFERSAGRKDYPLEPEGDTVVDILARNMIDVVSVGKVGEMFAGRGFSRIIKTANNIETIKILVDCIQGNSSGFIIANLTDFDTAYGHRNDVEGFARALVEFDDALPEILKFLSEDDMVILTADHGNDPTYPGTDHTREVVPLLIYRKGRDGTFLGVKHTFAVIGATILKYFHLPVPFAGEAFSEVL
jgi:phosphopentomutase